MRKGVGLLASVSTVAFLVVAFPVRSSAAGAQVVLCVNAGPRGGETKLTAISNLESRIGRRFAAHKDFFKWDAGSFPTKQQVDDAQKGRIPAVNWVARRRSGAIVPWQAIAAGKEDAVIKAWAADVKAYGRPIYLTFHHEPENDPRNGTPSEFIAAFRHVRSVFSRQGVTNVTWVAALMAYTFNKGEGSKWWPGDEHVDLLGLNGYSWYPGQSGTKWRSFSEIFQRGYAWAAARGERVMITETGVQEDPRWQGGNRKAQWFYDALSTARKWPLLKVFCYWHARGVWCEKCLWWIDTSNASMSAFREIANDSTMTARSIG